MGMEVPGKRRRGRPKRRWLDSTRNDLSERGLSEEDAQDRPRWRRLTRHIDPHIKVGKDEEEEDVHLIYCININLEGGPRCKAELHCLQLVSVLYSLNCMFCM